jgi:hypothetical protein
MNKEEVVELMARTIPEEDAPIILEIVKKTIEAMNLQPLISDEEFISLTNEQRYRELTTPRIGHASVTLTLDTYSHVLPTMQKTATEKLEKMMFGT